MQRVFALLLHVLHLLGGNTSTTMLHRLFLLTLYSAYGAGFGMAAAAAAAASGSLQQ